LFLKKGLLTSLESYTVLWVTLKGSFLGYEINWVSEC